MKIKQEKNVGGGAGVVANGRRQQKTWGRGL
jgi:hypothetical protein